MKNLDCDAIPKGVLIGSIKLQMQGKITNKGYCKKGPKGSFFLDQFTCIPFPSYNVFVVATWYAWHLSVKLSEPQFSEAFSYGIYIAIRNM